MSIDESFVRSLLDYEKEIIRRMQNKDSLLVLGRGLSVEKILMSLSVPYCDSTGTDYIKIQLSVFYKPSWSSFHFECIIAHII